MQMRSMYGFRQDTNARNVNRERNRGNPRQRWEKYITDIVGMIAMVTRLAENRHRFHKDVGMIAMTFWRR